MESKEYNRFRSEMLHHGGFLKDTLEGFEEPHAYALKKFNELGGFSSDPWEEDNRKALALMETYNKFIRNH